MTAGTGAGDETIPFSSPSYPHLEGDWHDAVVLCGSVAWEGSPLGSNFLARALSKHVPVLYVDPPRSLLRLGFRGSAREMLRTPRLRRAGDRLAVVSPLAPPGKDRPGIRRTTSYLVRRAIAQSVRALGGRPRAVVSASPRYDPFGVAGERVRVFRASDDFAAGSDLIGASRSWLEKQERRLAERADVVVCVSPVLVEKWRRLGYDPVLIPNGCDVAALSRAADSSPPDGLTLPRPIVGFVGQVSTRIDLDLLGAIADAGHSLLLVGGRRSDLPESRMRHLTARPNVAWVGHRAFEELPAYLGAMDVGLVPYTDSEFNRASFPLKTLEYLSAGLPVVATDLPAIRWLNTDLVTIASSPDAFVDAISEALPNARDEIAIERRQAFAARHSWDERATAFLDLLVDDPAGRSSDRRDRR